ncbi:MAG: hypothetical protein E7258_02745 [Lachnospiraceae bacterium]|nr:hypothetical protein [Lachnospiraceae bacterium]
MHALKYKIVCGIIFFSDRYRFNQGIVEGGGFLMSICAFLTEPLITFIIYAVLQYFIIHVVLEKDPLMSLQPSVSTYIETIAEDGFSIFVFKDWWVR